MTLRSKLREAAFWHEKTCLECGAAADETAAECPECGGLQLVNAASLEQLMLRWERETDEGD